MGCTSSAAASAAFANISIVGDKPFNADSALETRMGRSVAALTAMRASAITSDSSRYQTAAPTAGQSSAESAVNFSYQAQTLAGCKGMSTSAINSSRAIAVW